MSRFISKDIDNQNWKILFNEQMKNLEGKFSRIWLEGFKKIGIDDSKVPTVEELNQISSQLTGWQFLQTDIEFSEAVDWIGLQTDKKMPISNFVRTPDELYYCDEPDKWHDIIGHIPFLMVEEYSQMYQAFGKLYLEALKISKEKASQVENMIWYITEVALIRENDGLKAFGTTLYSSSGELEKAFEPGLAKEFSLDLLTNMKIYNRKDLMDLYLIITSIDQIYSIMNEYRKKYL